MLSMQLFKKMPWNIVVLNLFCRIVLQALQEFSKLYNSIPLSILVLFYLLKLKAKPLFIRVKMQAKANKFHELATY